MRTILILLVITLSSPVFAQASKCACCTEKHAEFDFWIGDWVVTNPDGSAAGSNLIKKIQNKCILQENWVSAKGNYTGTSNNFYNAKTDQWEQIWVDNQGQSLHLKGNRKANQMILVTEESTNDKGQLFYHRVTWTSNEDGSVRQLWETITNGSEITIAFDGLYKKK